MEYYELSCKSNFSFLEGASHADELIEQAASLGYRGLAITDRNSLAGVVRGHTALRDLRKGGHQADFQYIVGCEVHSVDGPPVLLWPTDRTAYGRLCRLLSLGRLRTTKGLCQIYWEDIADHAEGMLAGLILQKPSDDWMGASLEKHSMAERWNQEESEWSDLSNAESENQNEESLPLFTKSDFSQGQFRQFRWPEAEFPAEDDASWKRWLNIFRDLFGAKGSLCVSLHHGVDDESKLQRLIALSKATQVPLVATGHVLYHQRERSLLHDCLTAIAVGKKISDIASYRPSNAEYGLRPLKEIFALFGRCREALQRTGEIAEQIHFSLEELRFEYPTELAPDGREPMQYLKELTWEGAKRRYPKGVPDRVVQLLKHEVALISELRYEAYFLTVWDLVRFARSKGILCQGRGSAANSIVCYCLGVTSVDPFQMDLLFERFISKERNEAPDIDVDFEHQRREEVLQYIYQKYGRHRAGMTATVITYRTRSAVRDCGKALGISLDRVDALAKIVDGRTEDSSIAERCAQVGIDPDSDIGRRFLYLLDHLVGFPRHLSQHVGGMVMTQGALHELCPIENAAMEGRTVIQWDKNDLDELGILKVDCLSLGMLSAIRRSFELIKEHHQRELTLATVPQEDARVYDQICAADTVGVFQIESRAQMSMLPRLRPRTYYDLVIEVAIVRPGPIQGQMVHPYLKARQSGIQPDYPTEAIRKVLEKTMGVPIFQEQAMRLAVVAAGFTPGEADQLRRAMAAFRRPGVIDQFRMKLIEGMKKNGLNEEFADRVFTQIRGFGEYGFPESHAASFALLVYVSAYIKCYYPAAFCASILNSLPMGFYGPSQLIQDAQRHGVIVRAIDINRSQWECTLERIETCSVPRESGEHVSVNTHALRLGFSRIQGIREDVVAKVLAARKSGPFRDLSDLVKRTKLGQAVIAHLARSGALESITGDRRAALWQTMAQEKTPTERPLFDHFQVDADEPAPQALSKMNKIEEVYADFETVGISLKGHPVAFCRSVLDSMKVTPANQLMELRNGRFVRVAGLVVLRQRPSTAKGITFVTLEDETGSINLVIRPTIWKSNYLVCKRSNAWIVHGILETRDSVSHVIVGQVYDMSQHVAGLATSSRDFR